MDPTAIYTLIGPWMNTLTYQFYGNIITAEQGKALYSPDIDGTYLTRDLWTYTDEANDADPDEEDDEVDGDDDDEIIISAGETLYDTFCGSCHGLNGSGGQASAVIGATVEDIDNAVANEATMAVQVSVLSRDFLTKIVEYLDQNESSSNDSNSGGGGAIYWLWLLFPAYWLLRRRK